MFQHRLTQLTVILLLLFFFHHAAAHDGMRSFAPVLKQATPAVVNISVTSQRTVAQNPFLDDPFFRRFFDVPRQSPRRSRPSQSAGSGVIIDALEGHVVTNHHVVDGASEVTITLQDRRQFDAEIIGSDPETDIALLKIDADDISDIPIGDSDTLEVGDFVVAIGNPFGIGQTVTSGIVSALGRSGLNLEGYEDFIQTDASINPGNSGGALIDIDGNLVGINTAILTPAGGNVGIGFAVPVSMMNGVISQLLEHGEVHRGRLGVYIQDVTPDLADALKLKTKRGAVVSQVEESSAADRAGLEPGDVITTFADKPIDNAADLRNSVGLLRAGETVTIEFMRGGKSRSKSIQIGERNEKSVAGAKTSPKLEGAEFRNITPSHPQYGQADGVEIAKVAPGSRVWRSGLRQGDIIRSVNQQPVSTVKEFTQAIEETDGPIALNVQRGNAWLFLAIR